MNLTNDTFYLRANDTLVINANNTQFLVNTVNQSDMALNINCYTPLSLSNNSSGCKFNQTGYFTLNNANLSNTS